MKFVFTMLFILITGCSNNISTQINENKSFDYTHTNDDYANDNKSFDFVTMYDENKPFDYTHLQGFYTDDLGLIYYIHTNKRFTTLSCNSYIYTLNIVAMSDDEWFLFKDNCRKDVYNIKIKYDGVLYIEIECEKGIVKYQATKLDV